ncbi:ephrin type-A receptor 4a-like isoform X2 [Corticium candelabrum]|nr:ephrin type-A receptor 4a-like isoform X2 [Corticium candelabrum]
MPAVPQYSDADRVYDSVIPCDDSIYWQPAKSVEKLYAQFAGKRFRMIQRCDIVIQETLGSGEFGTVAKGTWMGSEGGVAVAVKMLNSSSNEDRVRFLQEGAIMGQFKHKNIVALRGLVLDGEPLMAVIEFMENGDLKQYLQSVSDVSDLSKDLLRMAREIASGMEYLSQMAFIHRDLAVRNVMLDSNFTCKIGDFGLSRDLSDSEYYITNGGKIPIRWTAPEAVMYRKYSAASDVWSYGIVLHEIWTIGRRPYDPSWNNDYVMKMVEAGYRLPPPPGCSRAIYDLMIRCWHPDHHLRPKFDQIACELGVHDRELLTNGPGVESIRGRLGEDVDTTGDLYDDLQRAYLGMSTTR